MQHTWTAREWIRYTDALHEGILQTKFSVEPNSKDFLLNILKRNEVSSTLR